jgi:phage tail sheath gpL-like
MAISPTSLAAGNALTFKNVPQVATVTDVPRKLLITGTYLAAKTGVVPEVPVLITSAADMANRAGDGTDSHRLAIAAYKGSAGSVEKWWQPQAEAGAAAAAVGEVTFVVGTVEAGTLHMFIGGDYVPVTTTAGMTLEQLTDACVAAIAAKPELPLSGATAVTTFELDLTAKSAGVFGNDVTIAFNLVPGQTLPGGVTSATVTVPMAGGSGIPTISDALNALGTGDDANQNRFTAMVHPYGQDSATLLAISDYIGATDQAVGTYLPTAARPFYSAVGDTTAGSAGLTAALAFTDARRTQRGNGFIAAPGEYQHPAEIAANVVGTAERQSISIAGKDFVDTPLSGITPYSVSANRWTKDHTQRETAVQGGVGTTQVKGGVLTIQNFISMSRPANVPVASNVYRAIANQVKTQNMIFNDLAAFATEFWAQAIIVADVAVVGGAAKTYAKDVNAVKAVLVSLANQYAKKGWLYTAAYTIEKLNDSDAITPRVNGTGFDYKAKRIYSGTGGVMNGFVEADTSLAVFFQ